MDERTNLKKTPLNDAHVALGARMMEFAGWNMPIQYSGIKKEHLAVRTSAGLFDVSHMGQIAVKGAGAFGFLQKLTTNDLSHISDGQAQYTAFLNERGGIIDDLIVYRRAEDDYLLCVNASNTGADFDWIKSHVHGAVEVADLSDSTALLALQGPESDEIISKLADTDVAAIKRFNFLDCKIGEFEAMISRTGYTGERGYELFLERDDALAVWDILLDKGGPKGLVPAGLGCRDTLRLEMGYSLHGNDIDEDHSPYESALGWICSLDKGDFIGREALLKQKGIAPNKLVGLVMAGKSVPRHGYDVLLPESGVAVGKITSGTMSPSLNVGIAMARIIAEYAEYAEYAKYAKTGFELDVEIRDKKHRAKVVRPPFFKKK